MLPLPPGTARLAVVADTHGNPHPALDDRLREYAPRAILHAGDIGDPIVLDRLAAHAELIVVRGNIDAHRDETPDVVVLDLQRDDARVLRILLVHIAVNGPRLRADVVRLARARRPDLVICGHSHVPFIGRDQGFAVFNPGSVGPRRFQLPIVFGTLEIGDTGVRLAHVDCATGQRWLPPGLAAS